MVIKRHGAVALCMRLFFKKRCGIITRYCAVKRICIRVCRIESEETECTGFLLLRTIRLLPGR